MSYPKGKIPTLDEDRDTGKRQLYFKVFQDRECIDNYAFIPGEEYRYWVGDLKTLSDQMILWGNSEHEEGELKPIAEPVFLTKAEFDALPDFEGY